MVNWEEMKTVWKKLNVFVAQNYLKEDVQIPAFSETLPQPMGAITEQAIAVLDEIF